MYKLKYIAPVLIAIACFNGAATTGYAATTGEVSVPDGGTTIMLLGVAFGALGMARRYLNR